METEISKLLGELMMLSVMTRMNGGHCEEMDVIIEKYKKHYLKNVIKPDVAPEG